MWSMKKAVIFGLCVGAIVPATQLLKGNIEWTDMQIYLSTIRALTPVALFTLVCWIHNLWVGWR